MADSLGSWAHLIPAFNCTGPNRLEFHWEWKNYTIPLSLPYLAIMLIAVFQLWRLYYYKHKMFSFQFWFLMLCVAWSFLRFFYFILFPLWHFKCWKVPMDIGRFVFWVPYWLQFATFSFLLVFYSTVQRSVTSHTTLDRAYGVSLYVWLAVNVVALIIILLSVSLQVASLKIADIFTDVVTLFISFLYFLLSSALLYYSLTISRMLLVDPTFSIPFHPKWMLRWWVFSPVSVFVCCLFLSRSLYDSISILTPASIAMTAHQWWAQLLIVAIFLSWDILPAAAVVALFFSIPRTVLGGLRWSTPGPEAFVPDGKLGGDDGGLSDPLKQSAYLLEREAAAAREAQYGTLTAPGGRPGYSPHAQGFTGFSVTGTHSPASLRGAPINEGTLSTPV